MRYRLRLATWTVVREHGQPSPRILSDPAAAALLALDLARACDDDKEHFFAVLLNAQNQYLMHTEVEGAASLILVHNHPSGDPTPSREDLRLTRQLADAARLLDLRLHDHIIVGNGTERWVSLAQRGEL